MDYFYMSKQDEEAKENPMLVMLNEETNEKFARAVGNKGVGEEKEGHWIVKDANEELEAWGHPGGEHGKMIIKSDGERSLVAFREALATYHGGIAVPEASAKGGSEPNGAVENAGGVVRGFTRVSKEQLEENAKIELASDSCVVLWMIRWAAMIASRYLVGKGGMTGQERRRGRRCKLEAFPFGEKVMYREIREGKEHENKGQSEVKEGIWHGHARNSNEHIIGTR